MMKMFTRGFLSITVLLFSLFAFLDANSQCANSLNWEFNPPPVNGAYEPGQVINVCLTFTTYQQASASWFHGVVLDFPPGWDISSITNASGPASCSGSNGTWNFYPNGTTATGSGLTFGAGFFYDVNVGGPMDGNPGNNWGDPCTTFGAGFTFCFDITIDMACGGAGNPLDGDFITPAVQLTGDGQSGSWTGAYTPCSQSADIDPDIDAFTIHCCDAESGLSPGTQLICENGIFNLFDLLIEPASGPIDVGGFWTGPAGYIDPSGGLGLGTFDPTTDLPGDYTYNVIGSASCISSTTITMEYNTLGLVQSVTYCDPLPTDLETLLTVLPLPPGGTWYAPGYPGTQVPVPFGLIYPASSPAGVYTYVYYDAGNCPTTLEFQVTFSPAGAIGLPGSADVCTSDPGCYQPFYDLQGTSTPGGNWLVYDATGTVFLQYIINWDHCFDLATYHPSSYYGDFIFTYILGNPPCDPALVDVEVTVHEPADTGENTTLAVCITDPPFDLEIGLDGTPDSGWEWSDAITGTVISNIFDPGAHSAGDVFSLLYSGGFAGTSCESNTLLDLTILPAYAYAGEDETITLCQADNSIFMLDFIPGNGTDVPQTGGIFRDPLLNNYGDYFTPGVNAPGTYVFTYTIESTCATDEAILTIILLPTLNPGTDGILDICDNETAVQLSGGLTGPFDTGGVWTDLFGMPVPATVDGNTVTDGSVYTYTVGTAPCEVSANVTINLLAAPNAGVLTTTPQNYCDSDAPIDLMTLFTIPPSATPPNASWTGPMVTGISTVDPSNGSAASGVYTYTIFDTGCGPASVSISITIEDTPDAGLDGIVAACPNGIGTIDLFAELGGSPAAGGSWTNPSNLPDDGIFNPAINEAAGVYTYSVGTNCIDQATVTVSYETLPNPGTSNFVTVCASDPSFLLIDEMGSGAVAGSWSDPSNNPFGNTFNPATDLGGVYTNTVNAGSCPSVSATLTIIVTPVPDAGADATTSFCETAGFVDLVSYLIGTPESSGTWTDASNNIITNPLDVSSLCGNSYAYTYTVGSASCNSSSTLSFDVICTPSAGSDGTIDLCSNDANFSLFSGLTGTYDAGGLWTNSGGSLVLNPSNMNPASLGTGDTFTYTVTANPCANATADVVVSVTPPITASFSSTDQTICVGSSTNLTLSLGGGTPSTYIVEYSDGTSTFTVNPASDNQNIPVNPITTTTYTLTSVTNGSCTGIALGSVTITVEPLHNAGSDVPLEFCADGSSLDLTTILSPDADTDGTFSTNPINLNASNSGTYIYSITGNQCASDDATYTVDIYNPLSYSLVQTSCEPNQTEYTVSFTISGGKQPYTVNGTPLPLGQTTYTSAVIPTPTPYSFTISDAGPCADISLSGNAPNCNCPVNASFSSGNETICIGSSADLVLNLSGGTDGQYIVSYSPSGVPMSPINGASNGDVITVSPTTTTTYTLTAVEDNNCPGSVNGSVTITVEQLPNAGNNTSLNYCGDGSTLVLTPAPGEPVGGTFTPSSVPLNQGTSVVTYTMAGNVCPDDVANYTLNIDPELEITNLTAVCAPNQLEYTVAYTIVGGTPPYYVDGVLSGSSFSETLIFGDNPTYSFVVSDSGPCDDVVLDQIVAPDCNCIAEGSISGSTSICTGDCTDIVFTGIGDAPFNITYTNSVTGASTTLTGIFNGHLIPVCPASNATFTLTAVSDSYCEGEVSGNSVTVNVDSPVVISNITEICNNTAETYQVQFDYAGGVPPYTFNNGSPSATPGTYLSAPIASGNGYNISVGNAGACPDVVVSSSTYTCACLSDAGTLAGSSFEVCYGETASVSTNGTETLDGNDVLQYLLHDGDAGTIGTTILESNSDGIFTFDSGSMVPGVAYYINAVVGNHIGGGNVNLNGVCTSLSNGVQVVMNALPTATISGDGIVCPGESVDLIIARTGVGAWDFTYEGDGDNPQSETVPGSEDQFTLTVSQPGQYTLVATSDSKCIGTVSGIATVQNYETPTATLTGTPTVCEGTGDGPQVVFTGDGPWNFVYSLNGDDQQPVSTSFTTFTIPVEVDGTYALVSLQGSNCTGTVSGSQYVEILDSPTASITGGGTICAGDSAPFDVVLTGTGPWNVQYTVDGVPQNQLSDITDGYSFLSSVDGDYILTSVSDANCNGEVLTSQASLFVNPLPTSEITSSKSTVCIGEEVQIGIDLEGVPPFNVTYVINGDTTIATGLYSDYFQTFQPVNPINFEVLFIEDGSNPTCTAEPMNFTYIDAVILPNAPVLNSDTVCSYNGPVNIGVNAAPGLTYSWSPETNLSSPGSANTMFQPSLGGPYAKVYEYVLTATNGECSATDTMSVTVDPGPKAKFKFTPDPVSTEDPTVFFTNQTIGRDEVFYYWEFDSLDTSNDFEPVYKFPDGINDSYTVRLTAIDPITGCIGDYSDVVKIQPEMLIYVPSAFTPDGDGLNDLWAPVLTNVDADDYKLSIYSRLGQLVFSTTDATLKWNGGMMNDGYYVEPGVYVWMIETKNNVSLEEIDMKGTVTVVR